MCIRVIALLWKVRINFLATVDVDRRTAPQCMLRMCRAFAASKPTKSLYTSGLEATKYDGTAMPLASLAGKVSIVVNVASR